MRGFVTLCLYLFLSFTTRNPPFATTLAEKFALCEVSRYLCVRII